MANVKVKRPLWEAWIVDPSHLGYVRGGYAPNKQEAWKLALSYARSVRAKEFFVVSPAGKQSWYRTSKEVYS